MRFAAASFTHPGAEPQNRDAVMYTTKNGIASPSVGIDSFSWNGEAPFRAVISRSIGESAQASSRRAAECFLQHTETGVPDPARMQPLQTVADPAAQIVLTGCVIDQNQCVYAAIGDLRLYHFSDQVLKHITEDHTQAYVQYRNGKIPYDAIRLSPDRHPVSAYLGGSDTMPRIASYPLLPSDCLLLCSDGFWQYVYETEMVLDLCAAVSPADWLRRMLLRLTQRSLLQCEPFSAVCILCEADADAVADSPNTVAPAPIEPLD